MLRTVTSRLAAPRTLRVACSFALPRRSYSNAVRSDSEPLSFGPNPVVKYTENHEWIVAHDKLAYVGITQYAADALGDTTYVEVNDPTDVEAGDTLGSVESVKSASDVYAPVSGKLLERNEELISNPGLLNTDPMGAAWLAKLEIANTADLERLLSLEEYQNSLEDH